MDSTNPPSPRRALAALAWGSAVYALFFNVQPVLVGALQTTHGFDPVTLGQIMSAGLGAAFLVLASSLAWVHRVRRRRAIGAGLVVALVGLLLLAAAGGLLGVLVGTVLFGGGLAVTAGPVVQALGSLPDPTRAFSIGVTTMVLVAAACAWVVPALVFPAFGLPGVVALLMALVALMWVALPWVPELDPEAGAAPATGRSALPVWIALGATAVFMLGLNSNWVYLEVLGQRLALGPGAIGASLSSALALGAVGSTIAAATSQRLSIAVAMLLALLGFAGYAALMATADGAWGFGVAVVALTLVWNFALPWSMTLVQVLDPDGRMLALIPAGQALGATLGPLVAGPLLVAQGPTALFILLLVCAALVAATCSALMAYHRGRHPVS